MSDELLPYYNQELGYLRKLGAEFAKANPKIAGRLRWGADLPEDPHVARMIEAFAYLNARTRHKLDDDFPELAEAMLGVLYPHYLAPRPSAAVVQFELDRAQSGLTSGYQIKRGSTLETEPVHGKGVEGAACMFRTCYDVGLWPIELKTAELRGHPFQAPTRRYAAEAQAVLRLQLSCLAEKVRFRDLPLGSLRFFLNGSTQHIYDLYELILNNAIGVAVASSPSDPNPVLLPKTCIRPIGFSRDEAVLPDSPRAFPGYRLLSEYFAFPQKFLFFEVAGLGAEQLAGIGSTLELYVFLNRHRPDLESDVERDTFRLGCTPIVNLYRQRAEPIRLSQTQFEYRVVPDARRPLAHEVYSIDRVVATSPDDRDVEIQPFYSVQHAQMAGRQRAFWHATRRPAGYAGGEIDKGTELFLSVVDLDFTPTAAATWTLDIETTCINRDLPRRLPFGGGQPKLQLSVGAPLGRIACLTAPTPTLRPALRRGAIWRLISHLSLNHLSLLGSGQGADSLREILKLYDYNDSPETHAMIDGLLDVRSRRTVGRVGGAISAGFCRGVEVSLHFDEDRFSGSSVYLFASVLERFLALYSSLNSFTKTIATTNRREEPLCRWPPRAGEKVLL